MDKNQFEDVDVKVVICSSLTDLTHLSKISNVILTSLKNALGVEVSVVERESSLKETSEKRLSIVKITFTLEG